MEGLGKLSVIIPVYNGKEYLKECADSVLKQKIHKEIILVDDGSTDGSGAICDELTKTYDCIRCVHTKNNGVSAARNKGIELASGDYILFLDSDDYLDEIEFTDNNYDMVLFGFRRFDNYKNYPDSLPGIETGMYEYTNFIDHIMAVFDTLTLHAIGTKIYKKEIINQYNIRFREDWNFYEDIYFCLSYLKRCKQIYVDNRAYYNYRINNANSLSSKKIKHTDVGVIETFELLRSMNEKELTNESKKTYYDSLYYTLNYVYKSNSNQQKYYQMFLLMNQWVKNRNNDKHIADYLHDRKIERIAIYGFNYIGETLFGELSKSDITIAYAIDKNPEKTNSKIHVYSPEEDLPKVDAVLVTSIFYFDAIKKKLGDSNNIISIEEIVFSL